MAEVNQQEVEDLRGLTEVEQVDFEGFIFQDLTNMVSPGRRMTKLYSMVNGAEIPVMRYRVREWLQKRENGRRMFTQNKDEAPEYIPGTERCFLADDSPPRMSGQLVEAGLAGRATCRYKHGASPYVAEEHGRKKHPQEWRMWQDYQRREEQKVRDERQAQQTEATLRIAGMAVESKVVPGKMPSIPLGGESVDPKPEPQPAPVPAVTEWKIEDFTGGTDDTSWDDKSSVTYTLTPEEAEAFAPGTLEKATNKQLREICREKGIKITARYVANADLIKMIKEAG